MSYSVHFLGHLLTRLQEMSSHIGGISIPHNEQASIDHIMWIDDVEPDITQQDLDDAIRYAESMGYREARMMEYPSIVDQLDLLYHEGYDGWRSAIEAVKLKHPKPDEISDAL